MSKITMGPRTLVYPTPTTLIGAIVDGKPDFMTAAWCGIACSRPPMVAIGIQPHRYTYKGIREHMTFSVNIPSVDMVKETDFCGMVSGSKVDKMGISRFDLFSGKLDNCPLIEQCPVNLECKVAHILEMGSHCLVIGRIEESYVSESCMTDGSPDIVKINPLIFSVTPRKYYSLGGFVADAFNIGEGLKPKG